ncbi:MAG: serine protease [Pyrinomonadaceae bacterium]
MSWSDFAVIEKALSDALETFNWPVAETICAALIERINTEADLLPEAAAKRLLQKLRRKRRFRLMTLLAEALIRSGQNTAQVRRQYAQALIEQGVLAFAPEQVLTSILQDSPPAPLSEQREAHGLLGRIYKQMYIGARPGSPRNQVNLEHAVKQYLDVYAVAPVESLWHGINVVALLARARRDGVALQGLPDPSGLAEAILQTLKTREDEGAELPSFDVATALEALIALGRYEEAEARALEYASCKDTDAFEVASTLRQLTEVWQLNDAEAPGAHILPILRAALLGKEGASLTVQPEGVKSEIARAGEAARDNLEKVFGADRTQSLFWYTTGLERCKSIARVERLDGKGHGTGWLVRAEDFFAGKTGTLLLTNAHVVSRTSDRALLPDQVKVNFQVLKKICEVDEIVWSSPIPEFDATFLSFKGDPPEAEPLPIESNPVKLPDTQEEPPQRMYIIGHPGGRDLEFSLQDNLLLACSERLLHYRTPTEGGSSGSPVFEPVGWKVVGLHHAGMNKMERLDGVPGTYEANEGIAILAIREATKTITP